MGPRSRYLGPETPKEVFIWQDIVPEVDHPIIDDKDIRVLKELILGTGINVSRLVSTAWASASTFRHSDKRGGANGARIRFAPQKDWEVNNPGRLASILSALEDVQSQFNNLQPGIKKKVSLADLIVLAGVSAIEKAAEAAGHAITVPFAPGRTDTFEQYVDRDTATYLEPFADGFRNYHRFTGHASLENLLIDRSELLTLSAQEMTALVGGMRVLDTNFDGSSHGVWTHRPGTLSNDFFVNLLDMDIVWQETSWNRFEGTDSKTGAKKWTGTCVDLFFGSHAELRAIAEVYGSSDGADKFVSDFVAAWDKVMNSDRFDIRVA